MSTRELKYLFLIFVIFIAACIETDIYLPAFCDMMQHFQVSEEKIQSLLTWNFLGMCLAGPVYGPISDAIGRKMPLLFALSLFLIGSVLTVVSDSFTAMLFGRLLQGVGSGGCFTLGTAILFDAFQREKAIDALNKMNSVVPFLLASAPMIGGYLNLVYGFRSNFLLIAIFVFLSLVISLFFFEETKEVSTRKKIAFQDIQRVLCCIPLWQTILIASLLFAGYLTFLSTISVLYVTDMGIAKEKLPFYQAAILLAWLLASITLNRAVKSLDIMRVKRIGMLLVVFGGGTFLISCLFAPKNPELQTFLMMFYTFGFNWAQSLYFPEGMEIMPDSKGISASLLTSTRLFVTSGVVALSAKLYDGSIYPFAMLLFVIISLSTIIIYCYEKARVSSLSKKCGEDYL